MRLAVGIVLVMAALAWLRAAAAESLSVEVTRFDGGARAAVEARIEVPARPETVWGVLADYEGMPRFVPDLHAARFLGKSGGVMQFELKGEPRLAFLKFPIELVLDVELDPGKELRFRSSRGNFGIQGVTRVYRGGDGGTRVEYRAVLEPGFWIPPFIGTAVIGHQIRRQFEGMVGEMMRRQGQSSSGLPDGLVLLERKS